MGTETTINQELEAVVANAFVEAGQPTETANTNARLATQAICAYLLGTRVHFGRNIRRQDRDARILEASKTATAREIAAAEGLSERQVKRILKNQRKRSIA